MTHFRKIVLILCGLILVACGSTEADEDSAVVLESCVLAGNVQADCGTLELAENRDDPNSRTIPISFAVLPGTNRDVEPDPLFMLAGGPGQAATEVFPLLPALSELNRARDIVLIDQRGTGDSNPLHCDNLDDLDEEEVADPDEVVALMQACAAELAAEHDLTQYTTDSAVADFEAVRDYLGYDQINLYGASYGTRAAMTYARRYPDRVRTMVLDAVVGPDLLLFDQMPIDGQRALNLMFERCAEDADCSEQFPDLEASWYAMLDRLAEPLETTIAHPLTGAKLELELTQDLVTSYVFNSLYSPELTAMLPVLITQAAETGEFTPLVAQALAIGQSAALETGMLYSVTCAEDAAFIDLTLVAAQSHETDFGSQAAQFVEICEAWPEVAVADDLRAPLTLDVPTLLLSGEADPVTPPTYADAVDATLPNSLHLVVADYGHGVVGVGCMPDLVSEFIDAASSAEINPACLARIEPPPFWTSLTGPNP